MIIPIVAFALLLLWGWRRKARPAIWAGGAGLVVIAIMFVLAIPVDFTAGPVDTGPITTIPPAP